MATARMLVTLLLACSGCAMVATEAEPGDLTDQARAGVLEEVIGFGSNPGNLRMLRYVPADVPPGAPLVVALHGCLQSAADYGQAGWNRLADEQKFYVLYPEQKTFNNAGRCFNWGGEYGDLANLRRGEGENLSIKQMVDRMAADHSIDAARVFVTGFSAGGAQAALLLATWPDRFAAGGIVAGIPYHCATLFGGMTWCLWPGKDRVPAQWAELARAGFPGYAGPRPRLSLWAGSSDVIVAPVNQTELLEQFSELHGVDRVADVEEVIDGHAHRVYRDATGAAALETWSMRGMAHGVPVDPASGCGAAAPYMLDVGVCSSRRMAQFFGIAPSH